MGEGGGKEGGGEKRANLGDVVPALEDVGDELDCRIVGLCVPVPRQSKKRKSAPLRRIIPPATRRETRTSCTGCA